MSRPNTNWVQIHQHGLTHSVELNGAYVKIDGIDVRDSVNQIQWYNPTHQKVMEALRALEDACLALYEEELR